MEYDQRTWEETRRITEENVISTLAKHLIVC